MQPETLPGFLFWFHLHEEGSFFVILTFIIQERNRGFKLKYLAKKELAEALKGVGIRVGEITDMIEEIRTISGRVYSLHSTGFQ